MLRSPIFVVGSPRSGTSLLRRRLNQHPRLAICAETHVFSLVRRLAWRFGDLRSATNRSRLVEQFRSVADLYFHHSVDSSALCDRLLHEGTSYPLFFETLLDEYAKQQGKARCGEKSPEHALCLPEILRMFPDAQILHIVRDPRDVVASLRKLPWTSSDVVTNALLWKRHVRAAEAHQGRPHYLRIHYEELVRSPRPAFQRICQFLNEPYFEEWSSPFPSPPHSPFWWRQRQFEPITVARVGRWRCELNDEQVALIERITGPYMKALHYPRSPVTGRKRLSAKVTARELGQFCLYQSSQLWRWWVGWRLDRQPLLFYHRVHAALRKAGAASATFRD